MRFNSTKVSAPRFYSKYLRLTVVPFQEGKIKLNGEWIDATITYDEDGFVYIFTTERFNKIFSVVSRRTPTDISVPLLSLESLKDSPLYIHSKSGGYYRLYNGTMAYVIEDDVAKVSKIYISTNDGAIYARLNDDFRSGFTDTLDVNK
ncbi:hypothetical protein LMH73_019130 [Vibrio splendidus]|nr:hypothetical protein [Vibrio splendidus]MCC4883101.1 hypothetical protein [Vibrio splendidus]